MWQVSGYASVIAERKIINALRWTWSICIHCNTRFISGEWH